MRMLGQVEVWGGRACRRWSGSLGALPIRATSQFFFSCRPRFPIAVWSQRIRKPMFTRRSTALDSVLDSDGHTTDAGSRNRAKRASLQGAYSGQGLRAGHVQNMLLLLQDRLLEHRYEEASSIAVALSQTAKTADIAAQKLDVVEVVWKAALAILSSRIMGRQIWIEHMDKPLDEMLYNEGPMASQQGITDDQHGEPMHVRKRETFQIARSILRLLKQLLQNIYNPPSQLIVEYLLQHIRFGILDEAIETLERYITRYPYRDDALLLGYAGILLYIKIRTRYDVAQKDIIHTSEFRQALMHFEASFKIDFSQEMFLYYYLKLLFMSDLAKAQRAAEKFVRQNPKNIFALRYLLEIHRAQNAEPAEWLQIAETILLLDPVAPIQQTLKPIIEHYESVMAPDESGEVLMDDGGVVRCSELIVSFLGNRLDYGSVEESRDGVSDLWLWGKLLRFVMLLRHIDPQYRFGEAWQERGSWWLDVYYPVPSEGQQPTEVEEGIE
ncbi:uncharacterized protein BJ171DRAFT_211790 [Polychytrium aggregatum]|uniref:uncharacterized protein n=1 Tax=Polychytrium aggregatum TaxID=110093 RepID=UPI0022FED926|nr:uncharacterized protein BJ171DRAFT_211790 [Polychytrium aggregatum]KAI9208666.1 hypothetical protein BJ171DRAFT_211790 [Polychytrium aggregatum]